MNAGTRDWWICYFTIFVAIVFCWVYALWLWGKVTLAGVAGIVAISFFVSFYFSWHAFGWLKDTHPELYEDLKACRSCRCMIPRDRASDECQECFIARVEAEERKRIARLEKYPSDDEPLVRGGR